jgi:hypothetical protein
VAVLPATELVRAPTVQTASLEKSAANAPEKVETIGHVLKQLGAKNVALFSFEAVPSSFMVFFEPAGAVAKALRVKKRVSRAEYQKAASNPTLDKQL